MNRIPRDDLRFFDEMTDAASTVIRGLIVSSPGVGKSFELQKT